ncbi:MAG: CotH kinase family protein [Prevotellaceae bacterium]|nr:CotH kinase family protein [Candidatus Minthosoma equi]
MKKFLIFLFLMLVAGTLAAQDDTSAEMPTFSKKHGLYKNAFALYITPSVSGRTIYYTKDGSVPTRESKVYGKVLAVKGTCVLRAVEEIDDSTLSAVATASYIFPEDVIYQATSSTGTPIIPEGYPKEWGENIDIKGYAPAFYAMDREIVDESKNDVLAGFYDLPVVSIVTEKDYLFGKEYDEENGGIYIYTGAPIGSGAGRGWERQISLEVIGGDLKHDVTVDCGIKIHGGHSRVPEKNAKHALRLMFKSKYGPKKLYYPVFGDAGVEKYEDLILRTHHSNSWLHWDESNRQRAQYTRDLWARSVQERLGAPHSKGQMVHVFLNGLYWGMYTLTERITAEHCALHYGGKEKNYDVIKVDEMDGENVIADEGTLDAWNEMCRLLESVSSYSNTAYYALQGLDRYGNKDESRTPLLDMDNFIDYMIINFYTGNSDWDHHNWFAFRDRESTEQGFRFICWDTELIFGSENDNITDKENSGKPTHFLRCLMRNKQFKNRFNHRAHVLLTNDGILTPDKAVEVWDSLYHIVEKAVYDESARWGTYRRDVQPYMSKGHRYRVDTYYMNERNRLLTKYFPKRTDIVLSQLKSLGWYSIADGIDEVYSDCIAKSDCIYDLSGRECGKLLPDGKLPASLSKGIYIVNGLKIMKQE